MHTALYSKDGIEREINAESISSRKDYLENYRGYLFCPHPNCPAHISFAETPTFTTKKIFKTSKNSSHADDCPYKIMYNPTKKHIFSSETINQALSDRHKRDILKKLFYLNTNSGESTQNSSHTSSTASQPANDENVVTSPKSVASISHDAQPVKKGTREPVVKKRHCSDILPEDVGKLLGLDGYADNAVVSDDYVEITLKSNTKLLFYNAFKDSSSAAFSTVKDFIQKWTSNKQDLLICFIGIVEQKQNNYQIQIMDPSLITFNDNSIYYYMANA